MEHPTCRRLDSGISWDSGMPKWCIVFWWQLWTCVDNQKQYFEDEFLTSHPIVLKEFVNVFVFILLWGAYTKAYFNPATRFQNFKYNLIPGIPG